MTSAIIFAFIFAVRINFIPWSALSEIQTKNGFLTAKVDTEQIEANKLTKFLLKTNGYKFGANYISPKMTEEDILPYINR